MTVIRHDVVNFVLSVIYHPLLSIAIGNVYEATDSDQLVSAVEGLSLQSSGDGNAPTVGAIFNAARASEPDSSVFVFTDSSPSDDNLLGQAEAIITQKNLKVYFVHEGSSMNKRSIGDLVQLRMNKLRQKRFIGISPVYTELEIFSGGGAITVPTTEISDLATFFSFSAVQSDTVIFRRAATLQGNSEHNFLVDSYTFRIIVFINGQSINVTCAFTTPQGEVVAIHFICYLFVYFILGTNATSLSQYSEYRSGTLFIASINITDPTLYGQWTISLMSQGSYCIQILGDGELTFSTEVITTHPNTTDDINDLKPLVGKATSDIIVSARYIIHVCYFGRSKYVS